MSVTGANSAVYVSRQIVQHSSSSLAGAARTALGGATKEDEVEEVEVEVEEEALLPSWTTRATKVERGVKVDRDSEERSSRPSAEYGGRKG